MSYKTKTILYYISLFAYAIFSPTYFESLKALIPIIIISPLGIYLTKKMVEEYQEKLNRN